ncbi:hypothetical protein D1872_307020 [compost metagenome]
MDRTHYHPVSTLRILPTIFIKRLIKIQHHNNAKLGSNTGECYKADGPRNGKIISQQPKQPHSTDKRKR